MRLLFDPDSKIMQIISRICDIIILNIVFLFTCLPIFTIGAANTALYATVFRLDTEQEGKLLSMYFRAFLRNFRQSTVIFLILCVFFAATCVNMVQFSQLGGSMGYVLFVLSMAVFVILAMVFSYTFPLLSQFCNSTRKTLSNALILGVAHLPRTAVLLVVNCFPWTLMLVNLYSFIQLGFLWFALYFAAAAYFNSRVLLKVFRPYLSANFS